MPACRLVATKVPKKKKSFPPIPPRPMQSKKTAYTTSPCFTRFCFNAPCQLPAHHHLRSLIFGLPHCVWLRSTTLTPHSDHNLIFHLRFFLFTPTFRETNQGVKQQLGVHPTAAASPSETSVITSQHGVASRKT